MKLRCREGDLAIVIRDLPGLQANVGRFVWVYGPWREHPELGPLWGISATRTAPLDASGKPRVGAVSVHPDAWLLSVRCRLVAHRRPARRYWLPVFGAGQGGEGVR